MVKTMKRISQRAMLREHLKKHGSVTRLVASNIYDIIDLRRRIADLRKEGMNIETRTKIDDTGKKYTEYVYHAPVSNNHASSTYHFAA